MEVELSGQLTTNHPTNQTGTPITTGTSSLDTVNTIGDQLHLRRLAVSDFALSLHEATVGKLLKHHHKFARICISNYEFIS